jgi:hypothetical protein
VLEAVAKRGGSAERVLRAAGLRKADLEDPDRFVDLEKMLVLQHEAAREVGDDTLGLTLALTYNADRLGVLAYALVNAPNVGVALRNLERYAHTLLQGVRVVIERRGGECLAGYDIPVGTASSALNAEGASVRIRDDAPADQPDWPKRVEFGHRRPDDGLEHERVRRPAPSKRSTACTGSTKRTSNDPYRERTRASCRWCSATSTTFPGSRTTTAAREARADRAQRQRAPQYGRACWAMPHAERRSPSAAWSGTRSMRSARSRCHRRRTGVTPRSLPARLPDLSAFDRAFRR